MKIWSVIYPVLLYYAGCSIGSLFFSVGVPMVVGACVIFPIFKSENVQMTMTEKEQGNMQKVHCISRQRGWKRDLPLLLVFGASTALFFNILFALLQITGSSQQYAEVAEKQFAFPLWAGILLYGIVSPVAEEMVFRGIVFNRLKRFFGKNIAIAGSALIFGLYHGNMVQGLYGFILGLLIAFFYEQYGSFVVPVLLHSAVNVCVYIVSGNVSLESTLMNWTSCMVCGILATVLFFILVLKSG